MTLDKAFLTLTNCDTSFGRAAFYCYLEAKEDGGTSRRGWIKKWFPGELSS